MSNFAPRLVSWNLTKRCNLRCAHCYLDADARSSTDGELTSSEGRQFIDELADLCPGAMLIFSGGEPMLRSDLGDLIAHAAQRGLLPVLGTNGVLLTDDRARELADRGLVGVGLSLDSLDPELHDVFRGMPGAWRRTVAAIEACRRDGLTVQIYTSATAENYEEIPGLIRFASYLGAVAFNLFFLVCTGRGEEMTDITPSQYESALRHLAEAQVEYEGRLMIRARCAPHFLRLIHARGEGIAAISAGCMAGTEYFRVTPEGTVTPCPYMPLTVGDLRTNSLAHIWETAPVFQQLRRPVLGGRCGECEFGALCGGCRARAFAVSGDLMAEDPWCEYQPRATPPLLHDSVDVPQWTAEARARLERIPAALRPMVERGITAHARSHGLTMITPEVMTELRPEGTTMSALRKTIRLVPTRQAVPPE